MAEAATSVVDQLVETFAPVRKQVTINPAKALRTGQRALRQQWTFTDTFKAADKKMYVVVELPPACDRNPFKLTVVRKDQRQDLAVQEIRWSKEHKSFGYLFDPSQIAAKGGGAGRL